MRLSRPLRGRCVNDRDDQYPAPRLQFHPETPAAAQQSERAGRVRVRAHDARFFVTALLTQREMGGNLSEVLDILSSVIRERFKVKRQVTLDEVIEKLQATLHPASRMRRPKRLDTSITC